VVKAIQVDNGSEYIAEFVDRWRHKQASSQGL